LNALLQPASQIRNELFRVAGVTLASKERWNQPGQDMPLVCAWAILPPKSLYDFLGFNGQERKRRQKHGNAEVQISDAVNTIDLFG
jgi:hypothetical protein